MHRIDAFCKKEMSVINLSKLLKIVLNGIFLYIKEKLQKFSSEIQDKFLLNFLQDNMKEEQNEWE